MSQQAVPGVRGNRFRVIAVVRPTQVTRRRFVVGSAQPALLRARGQIYELGAHGIRLQRRARRVVADALGKLASARLALRGSFRLERRGLGDARSRPRACQLRCERGTRVAFETGKWSVDRMSKVQLVTQPVISVIAETRLNDDGVAQMAEWVRSRYPACLPPEFDGFDTMERRVDALFPHGRRDAHADGTPVSDGEYLTELCGRKCYNSFGLRAGKKTNLDYIENTQRGDVPHASIIYQAKQTFFIAGVSRRVSHELIRHYVGADRDEEGSPSQESTRYCEHSGFYVPHPRMQGVDLEAFQIAAQRNYDEYLAYLARQRALLPPNAPTIEKKRILESGSAFLLHSVETSFIWTTNAAALAKLFRERDHDASDLEMQRFARAWKEIAVSRWPNLFTRLIAAAG